MRRALPRLRTTLPRRALFSSEAGNSTFHRFDAAAKAEVFSKVFDGGLPGWERLGECVDKELSTPPSSILSIGDGPGEPGCYLAAKYKCATMCTDFVAPMVEAAKQRATQTHSETTETHMKSDGKTRGEMHRAVCNARQNLGACHVLKWT